MREDNTFFYLLSTINKKPVVWLGKKSLDALMLFWEGYAFRVDMERAGELDKPLVPVHPKSGKKRRVPQECLDPNYEHFMDGFEAFVYSHYKHRYTTIGWKNLISQNCNSEEEAFDKFFELLEEFFAQKGISIHPLEEGNPEGYQYWQS